MAEPEKDQQPQQPSNTEAANAAAPASAKGESPPVELPQIESPPLSPAGSIAEPEMAVEPVNVIDIAAASAAQADPKRRFLSRRTQRKAVFAASVMIAAAAGAVIGALAVPGTPAPRIDIAGSAERAAMQKSIAQLSKEISTLKAGIEIASKGTGAQIGKIGDRLERIEKSDRLADATGSITKPASAPAAAHVDAPLPVPRPTIVLSGWALRDAAHGRAVVENRAGDYYDVRPGDPLPGIGTVEAIKRENGVWQVVTTKGVINGQRPPSTASAPARRRSYYAPYYWPY
jgi:hypothetical protein